MAILDAIAMIHVLRLPVKEPARMKAALAHLESMIALSRESWKSILAETDNDHEWVPNPTPAERVAGRRGQRQHGRCLDDLPRRGRGDPAGEEARPLLAHGEERGVNLRRVFTEPRTFDLVLWVQGTAATPYLEKGPLTKPETWRRLQNVFRGEFIGFAFWFN